MWNVWSRLPPIHQIILLRQFDTSFSVELWIMQEPLLDRVVGTSEDVKWFHQNLLVLLSRMFLFCYELWPCWIREKCVTIYEMLWFRTRHIVATIVYTWRWYAKHLVPTLYYNSNAKLLHEWFFFCYTVHVALSESNLMMTFIFLLFYLLLILYLNSRTVPTLHGYLKARNHLKNKLFVVPTKEFVQAGTIWW